jgi:hypothetical protein
VLPDASAALPDSSAASAAKASAAPQNARPNVPTYAELAVGTTLPAKTIEVRRADLIRYAGASGDFNPIHWSDQRATSAGLSGVVAHGMLTMAYAARVVTDWVGDPGAIVDYGVRFIRPVIVSEPMNAAEPGAVLEISGVVAAKLADQQVQIDLTVTSAGHKVLGRPQLIVRLAS